MAKALLIALAVSISIGMGGWCASGEFRLMTWNVRGYPEPKKSPERIALFSSTLSTYAPDILCIQEIANADCVSTFTRTEVGYQQAAFTDVASDGQDNAVFARTGTWMTDVQDPNGFEHRAQLAFFSSSGAAAVSGYVLSVHLSFKDSAARTRERSALVSWALPLVNAGLSVIIAGDFNTTTTAGNTIDELAQSLGMTVIRPTSPITATTYAGSAYDWVLVTPSLARTWCIKASVVSFANETLAREVSNHRPVLVTFTPRPRSNPIPTPLSVNIQVSAIPTAGGLVAGGRSYPAGTQVTVVATPNSGYLFSNWSESGSSVSPSSTYSFLATVNRSLVAVFTSSPPLPACTNAFVLATVDAVGECITVRNASTAPADLKGWRLSDGEGNYTFLSSITVSAGGTYKVCMATYNPTRYTQGLYLNDKHDQVYLYAPVECGGGLVDSRAW
jgi:endonuclease/exonuclease/phosphatase family metal-dependent hydrolase